MLLVRGKCLACHLNGLNPWLILGILDLRGASCRRDFLFQTLVVVQCRILSQCCRILCAVAITLTALDVLDQQTGKISKTSSGEQIVSLNTITWTVAYLAAPANRKPGRGGLTCGGQHQPKARLRMTCATVVLQATNMAQRIVAVERDRGLGLLPELVACKYWELIAGGFGLAGPGLAGLSGLSGLSGPSGPGLEEPLGSR